MIAYTALFINLMRKQLTTMLNSTISLQIIKKIPISIERSRLSLTKEIFENSKDYYEQLLRQCRYNEKLYYTEENNRINPKYLTLVQSTLQQISQN